MHPLRINDGQDALLKLHSQAVARPKREPVKAAPLHWMAKRMGRSDFQRGEWAPERRVAWVGVDMARPGDECQSIVGTRTTLQPDGTIKTEYLTAEQVYKDEPAPEQWHTEAPPCAGVYRVRYPDGSSPLGYDAVAHWDGMAWSGWRSEPIKDGWSHVFKVDQWHWSALIEADAPQADTRPLLQWVKGCDVPEGERNELWHLEGCNAGHAYTAAKGCNLEFVHHWRYLRAAPGVREGEEFQAELYRSE